MGWFSSKKKTIVGTTITRAIEDNLLPDFVLTGFGDSLFNGGNTVEHVLDAAAGSIALKANRMYRYGGDTYVHGLPSGEFYTANQGEAAVKAVLKTLEGKNVVMDYSRYGPPNTLHLGWMYLIQNYGYNTATNELKTLSTNKGYSVYLKDMVVYLPGSMVPTMEPEALAQWGTPPRAGSIPFLQLDNLRQAGLIPHTPVQTDNAITKEELRVTYTWQQPVQVGMTKVDGKDVPVMEVQILEGTFKIIPTGYDIDKDYFHAKYFVGTQAKYWIYKVGSGVHPSLDNLFGAPPEENGSFFPFIYFRYDKKSDLANKSSTIYRHGKKITQYLGMDYDDIASGINENPDIKDVTQAMLIMAVPAKTEDPLEQRYLFDFFDRWYANTGSYTSETQANLSYMLRQDDPEKAKNIVVIQDKRFKMALSNNGIYRAFKAGSIGPVGSHTSGFEETTRTVEFTTEFEGVTTVTSYEFPVKYHYYRRQVTEGLYIEIKLVDLRMLYYVSEKAAVTADEEDDILLIPLDYSITRDYQIRDRETLYARSLHYVFNSLVIQKIKWYQQGWFKVFLVIVTIILTFAIGPGAELLSAIVANAATAVVVAAFVQFVIQTVIGIVISYAMKLFVKAVGIKTAIVLAVIMAVTGFHSAIQAGSIQGAPWATELLMVANGLISVSSEAMGELMKALLGEFSDFAKYVEEQTKLLDDANKLLETNVHLSPMVIFGESPEDFYNRTVHSGNIGTIAIDAVSEFVSHSLKLPELRDTLGGTNYELS